MWNDYVSLVDGFKLSTLIILFLVDFVAGVVVAIIKGEFQFSKLAQFLNTSVLALGVGYFLLGFLVLLHGEFQIALVSVWGLIDATMVAMIIKKLGDMGVPLPDVLKKIL